MLFITQYITKKKTANVVKSMTVTNLGGKKQVLKLTIN